ncbi:MAG: fused MFS/spermidine synthase [Halobacteriovoraceae bacterium]|jgi:spermidine synthase|nr:fused MFS/spermidine synthase [Halobacteriovoraceae bacterium]
MFKKIVLLSTFASGMTGLAYQICWQRYLSFLVGSEAKSISLVIAIFLCGLATGYNFWGKRTSKVDSKKSLLKLYGAIELGIGAFAILFPLYFDVLKSFVYNSPNNFFIDLTVTIFAILLPTFLMGGTVPILTSYFPDTEEEINSGHAKIYGLNTLGAFLGIVVALFMIPELGLSLTLTLMGATNLIIGIIFFLNLQSGTIQKQNDVPQIENLFGDKMIYLLVAVTGAVSLGLEVILVRALGLAMGMSYLVFPIILGLFIIGLGLGSLSLNSIKEVKVEFLFKELAKIMLLICLIYLVIPFWPGWINSWNVRLARIDQNFFLYVLGIFVFVGIFLIPLVYSFGRILPLGYNLLNKTGKNYGEKCGNLYFANTIGTLVGSLLFGYFLFFLIDLDDIFRVCMLLMLILFCFLLKLQGLKNKLTLVPILAIIITLFIPMNRIHHQMGVFRNRSVYPLLNFSGIFKLNMQLPVRVLSFSDGPNNSTTVLEAATENGLPNRSIMTNGKSDGSTEGIEDLSTMSLAAIYPYLFNKNQGELQSAVIGLGLGITAGLLGKLDDVKRVDVLEISKTVIDAEPYFRQANYDLGLNPKIKMEEIDAFKHFANDRHQDQYDIVVSEPSNPWVIGVENLYTPEFYELVKKSMKSTGVFVQWMHLYSNKIEIIHTVFKNLTNTFSNINIYYGGFNDILLVSSNSPLNNEIERRLAKPAIKKLLGRLYVPASRDGIEMLKILNNEVVQYIGDQSEHLIHSFNFPSLTSVANKAFFMGGEIKVKDLASPYLRRQLPAHGEFTLAKSFKKMDDEILRKCLIGEVKGHSFCQNASLISIYLKSYVKAKKVKEKLEAYSVLRDTNMIDVNSKLLSAIERKILSNKKINAENLSLLFDQYLYDFDSKKATALLEKMKSVTGLPMGLAVKFAKKYQLASEHSLNVQQWLKRKH